MAAQTSIAIVLVLLKKDIYKKTNQDTPFLGLLENSRFRLFPFPSST